ncbi:hypothetical protein ACIGKQ_17795 [Gordonia sp. NPDC062954]|uniref:hypothetical protein n=1 Tax=Gordonia sp. NPDC062954 TaxID=3364003 RepID=UPI0037CC9574
MNEDQRMLEAASKSGAELAVLVDEEGLVLTGDQASVERYLDRLRSIAGDTADIAALSPSKAANVAATAAGIANVAAQHGEFVRLSPASMKLLRAHKVIPGTDGFNRMMVVNSKGKFAGQLQWQRVSLGPSQAMALQMFAVQMALKSAIASVEKAVERVEDKVDEVLALAKADRAGDVVGQNATVTRLVEYLDSQGSLPAADWDAVAPLGPALEITIEKLRAHIKDALTGFDPEKPIQDRAKYLDKVVTSNQLGETLQLLVVAEDTLYQWQRLRIARVEETEPQHLESVVQSARDLLRAHIERDGEVLVQARENLADFARIRPLEIVRFMSTGQLKSNMVSLRDDLDQFAHARRSQVIGWTESEDPGVQDALAEIGNRAKLAAGSARALGAKAVDFGFVGVSRAGVWLQGVANSHESAKRKAEAIDDAVWGEPE